jgi:CDP-4-dehydro-6-deoxyglucose reductase
MPTFSVRVEPLGRTIVADADRPILEAALAAGINLPHSCKSGHCGSCRAALRAGEIAYPRGQRPAGLTEAEAAGGRVLLCQARACSDLVIEARRVFRAGSGIAPGPVAEEVEIRRLPCRIDEKRLLAPDVLQLWLRLPAVEPLPFRAGQYLDVLLEGGRRRSFSIASPPHDATRLELHVRRAPGSGFTAALFDAMPVGTLLRIEGPVGQFVYEPSDAPLLLLAGGTGFAPLKSILRQVLEVERATRPLHLYWGVRTPVDAYEAARLSEWCAQHPQLRCTVVVSEPGALPEPPYTPATLRWRKGWVHEVAAAELDASLAAHDVYVAGPPALVEAVRARFPALGLPVERVRFDSFDYAPR